ncbi:MAG TPA: nitroreductase family protein [Desulfobacteraceae bacterium]|nr:nitroreductase family protein [Desulfobacteraceae bacterium]HPJ66495.1 nitroreductase family protein [Desulfobacteraceae bacterium]
MIDLLRERRSIRKYEAREIELEKIEILKEALLLSPSSMNRKPWEFIFVDDKDLLAGLSRAKEHGAGFLRGAALGIVVCGDETVSDVWQEDCSIAAIIVQLAAQSIGLGSCWVQIRNRRHVQGMTAEEYVQGLLGLPENLRVECIISIGYPAEKKAGITKEQLEAHKGKIRHLSA